MDALREVELNLIAYFISHYGSAIVSYELMDLISSLHESDLICSGFT